MISAEKQYEFVTSQIAAHVERWMDAFKLFIQLFSAIIGGSIWLSTQVKLPPTAIPTYIRLSDTLVGLVTVITIVMVCENLRGWFSYRKTQSKLVGKDGSGKYLVPMPKCQSHRSEGLMILVMLIACGLFFTFNPFCLADGGMVIKPA